jgi:predicted dinucleotide-binding enzyme
VEEDTMAIAVIGAGNIGKTLTGLLSKAGEPVAIAASRVPKRRTAAAHLCPGTPGW